MLQDIYYDTKKNRKGTKRSQFALPSPLQLRGAPADMISKLAKKAAENPQQQDTRKNGAAVASIRIQRDLDNLCGLTAKVTVPDPNHLLNLEVTYSPPDGVWRGGSFHFAIRFPETYPIEPPKVVYVGPHRMWHPNIEGEADKQEWGVCISILRADWTAVLGLRDVIFGIEMLFFEPNIDDPLPGVAKEAAQHMKNSEQQFIRKTQSWMKGSYVA